MRRDGRRRPQRVVGDERDPHPGGARPVHVTRSARDRVRPDVDDAVEVEHREVVGLAQRRVGAFQALRGTGFPSLLDSTDGLARGGDPSVRRSSAASRALPRPPAEPPTRRGPGRAAALRPTVPGRRRPSQPVAGARPAAPGRRARAVAARVHRGRHDRPRPGRRPRRLPPRLQPGGPGRAAARGHPPGPGGLAGGPDDPARAQPGAHPAGAPGTRRGAAARASGRRHRSRPTTSSTGTTSGTGSGRSATRRCSAGSPTALAELPGADRRRPPPVCGLPPHAGARARRRVRPRSRDAGRPGGHPAVPRPDPPGAHRA